MFCWPRSIDNVSSDSKESRVSGGVPAGGEKGVVVGGGVVVVVLDVVVELVLVGRGADVVVAAGSVDSQATAAMQRAAATRRRPPRDAPGCLRDPHATDAGIGRRVPPIRPDGSLRSRRGDETSEKRDL
jgi:hypothetical protein